MNPPRRQSARRIRAADGTLLCSCGCGRTPLPPRRTWFSVECVTGWRLKNDPAFVRGEVLRRDGGVCAHCGVDTLAIKAQREALLTEPLRYVGWWVKVRTAEIVNMHSSWSAARLQAETELGGWRREIKAAWSDRSEWQADHILPVAEGGGQCGLENYRTLCTACHRKETAALAAQRAARAREARAAQRAAAALVFDPASFQLTA